MSYFEPSIEELIESFSKLPGIGHKTAQRLAFHVLNMHIDDVSKFANSLINAKKTIRFCSICQNLTTLEKCDICNDKFRD